MTTSRDAASHFNKLSEAQRIAAIARLPPHSKFSTIAGLEEVHSPEELRELADSLAEWVERTGAPELRDRYREWVTVVLASHVDLAGGALEVGIKEQVDMSMTTLLERARKWREELNQQLREEGIEQGRREGVAEGWIEGIGMGTGQGIERGWLEVERELVYRLVTRKFGSAAAGRIAPVLDGLSEPARIAAIANAVLDCQTVEELMALPVAIPEG